MSFHEVSVKLEPGTEALKSATVADLEKTGFDPQTTDVHDQMSYEEISKGNVAKEKAEGKSKAADERRIDMDLFRSKYGSLNGAICAKLPGWCVQSRTNGTQVVKAYIDAGGRKFTLIKDIEAHFGKRLRDRPDEPIQEVEHARLGANVAGHACLASPMPSATALTAVDSVDSAEAPVDAGPVPKPGARGYARGPEAHYIHQVQGVLEATGLGPDDYYVFLGRLGTGIIGVRPRSSVPSTPPARSQVCPSPVSAVKQEASDGACPSAAVSPSLSPTATTSAGLPGSQQPEDRAAIVLFVNLSAAALQWRDTHAIGGYSAMLDVETRMLTWQSQWIDKKSNTARQIVDWAARGGRVEIFVRTKGCSPFVRLGDVASVRLSREAGCLAQVGADGLQESGGGMIHRAITPKCLNPALMAGVGLSKVKINRSSSKSLCASCCFTPAEVAIKFRKLSGAGLAEYLKLSAPDPQLQDVPSRKSPGSAKPLIKGHKFAKRSLSAAVVTKKRALTKPKPKEEDPTPTPKRRIVGKVKVEPSAGTTFAPKEETAWRYEPFDKKDFDLDVRATPSLISEGTGVSLRPQQTFQVSEERQGDDGIVWLRLADGTGWVGDKTVNNQTMCVAVGERAVANPDALAAPPLAPK